MRKKSNDVSYNNIVGHEVNVIELWIATQAMTIFRFH